MPVARKNPLKRNIEEITSPKPISRSTARNQRRKLNEVVGKPFKNPFKDEEQESQLVQAMGSLSCSE